MGLKSLKTNTLDKSKGLDINIIKDEVKKVLKEVLCWI